MTAPPVDTRADRVLVLACGALARELKAIADLDALDLTVECLPAALHNRPDQIAPALRAKLDKVRGRYDRILVGYADCGTGGELDAVCADEGLERIPGAHCYQFFAGRSRFDAMHDADPTAFYLTDFLARHFDRLIMHGLGIVAHPELRDLYFGNYTRLVYLAQTDDPGLDRAARDAAAKLGLRYDRLGVGYGELRETVVRFAEPAGAGGP